MLKKIAEREVNNEHKGDMISPTALTGCARMLKLTRLEDFYAEPQRYFDATRGAITHGFLEGCNIPGVKQEQRVYKLITEGPYAPWLISGRIDYIDIINKRIEDIKTMSDKGLYVVFKDGFKPEHESQLNLYRWLAAGGRADTEDNDLAEWLSTTIHKWDIPGALLQPACRAGACDCPSNQQRVLTLGAWPEDAPGQDINWPVDELQLHFFFMNRVISTGRRYVDVVVNYERKKGGPNWGKPYGCEVSRRNLGANPKGYDTYEITLDIPPVPLWTFEKVEEFLQRNGPERVKAFREPDHMPKGVIGNKDLEWLCGYCDVREKCLQIEEAESVVKGLAALPSPEPAGAAA